MKKIIAFLLSLIIVSSAEAQTPVDDVAQQWHAQATVNGTNGSYDWIFDVIQTSKKDYIAVGYTRHPITGTTSEIAVPCFMKLDHKGKIVWIKKVLGATGINIPDCAVCTSSSNCICPLTITETAGHLWGIKEFTTSNTTHYMATGWLKDESGHDANLLVEFDESGAIVNGTPIAFRVECPTGDVAANMNFESCKARSIAMDVNSNDIILTGEATYEDNNNIRYRFLQVAKVSYSSSGLAANFNASYRVLGNTGGSRNDYRGGNSSYKVITRPATGNNYEIYIAGYKSSASTTDEDNQKFTIPTCATGVTKDIWKLNKDVWLLKMDQSLSIDYDVTYNKASSGFPSIQSQYHHTGPLTARDLDNIPPATAVSCSTYVNPYLAASVNSDERGEDIIFTSDGNLAMVASINRISIGLGRPDQFHDDNGHDYIEGSANGLTATRNGSNYRYPFYKDADLVLLRINASDGSLMSGGSLSKNVGHMSSREYIPRVIQNCSNEFIIAGSTADYYNLSGQPSDPDLSTPNKYDLFLIATDDNSSGHIWRRNLVSEGETAVCNFALAKTADDGFITGGDNDNKHGTATTGDDFSITKFAPSYTPTLTWNGTNDIVGNTSGVFTVSSNTLWNVSKKVRAKVVITSTGKLTISGSSTVISFASSDHIYDFNQFDPNFDGVKIGIVVEPGGQLKIENGATLRGIAYTPCSSSATNNRFMWDGIVVKGDPNSSQTLSDQGYVFIEHAIIQDARFGVVVANAWRRFITSPVATYTNSGYSFDLQHYGSVYREMAMDGGGIAEIRNSVFENCNGSVKFHPYTLTSGGNFPNNASYLRTNTFTATTTLADICEYPGSEGKGRFSSEFISGNKVKGVGVYNNTFTCPACTSTTFVLAAPDRPIGINLFDAGMRIDKYCPNYYSTGACNGIPTAGNYFDHLQAGVKCNFASFQFASYPVVITYNYFNNNGDGVLAGQSTIGLNVHNNEFNIPSSSSIYPYPTGVTLRAGNGYDVSANIFGCYGCGSTGMATNSRGVVVNNGHNIDNRIHLNFFNNVQLPTIALQKNGNDIPLQPQTSTGLQFLCNQYYQYDQYGIVRMEHDIANNISATPTLRQYQGICATSKSPAGNQFWNSPTAGDERLMSDDQSTGAQVVRYHNNDSLTEYDPYPGVGTKYVNLSCNSNPGDWEEACTQPLYGFGTGKRVLLLVRLDSLDAVIGTLSGEEEFYFYLLVERRFLVSEIVRDYGVAGHPDSAATLLAAYGRYEDAFSYYLQAGDIENAGSMLEQFPQNTDEEINYRTLATITLQMETDGKDWDELSSDDQAAIAGMATPNSLAGSFATAILERLGIQTYIWPRPDEYQGAGFKVAGKNNQQSQAQQEGNYPTGANNKLRIYPNPSKGRFDISSENAGRLKLLSLQGMALMDYKVKQGSNEMYLPQGLASGIYMLKFVPDNGGKASNFRLVYKP